MLELRTYHNPNEGVQGGWEENDSFSEGRGESIKEC